ncbi:MAG: acetyl esterase [Myxococcota bacterium]|jgi:acetyl esterase
MWRRAASGLLTAVSRAAEAVRPHERDGHTLDPQLRVALRLVPGLGSPRFQDLGPASARARFAREVRMFDPAPRDVEVHPGPMVPGAGSPLQSRIYRPRRAPHPTPALLFFHGGGFVIGDLDTHDAPCRQLCEASGCAVVSVAYRLAPEHRFPAAYDDAMATWAWFVGAAAGLGLDPRRLAVGGDSAGGNLSAGVAIAARDLGLPPPRLQLLIYPGTELRRATRSHRLFDGGYMLTAPMIDWFLEQYAPDPDDPRASPLLAPDLSGLAPAHVVLAGFDPLRDEGRAFASRLAAAGTPVTTTLHPGLVHGFLHTTGLVHAARDAVDAMAAALRDALA